MHSACWPAGTPPATQKQHSSRPELGDLPQFPDGGAEVCLDAVGLLEAVLEQQLGERLVLRTAGGGEVRLQPGSELAVRGQGGHVDQLLDTGDGHLVEGRDPAGERVGGILDLGVRDDAVHVAVFGGQAGRDVVAAEQDLQGAAAAGQARQPRHRAAAGDGADADLELAQDRRFGGEADVGGENELAARAAGPAADLRDGGHRQLAEPDEVVQVRVQAGRAGPHRGHPGGVGQEIPVGHEVARLVATEHDYGQVRVALDLRDERAELVDGVRVQQVYRALSKVTRQ